jgi:hypothetical protein
MFASTEWNVKVGGKCAKKGTNERSSQEGENKNINGGEERCCIEMYKTIFGSGLSPYKLLIIINNINAPRRYPYFDVMVGFVWSRDPKSYAGGSVCFC